MPLYYGNKKVIAFNKGAEKYRPLNIYYGNKKITGCHPETKTGEIATWLNTYNDKLRGVLYGKSVQKADYVVKDGLSEQRALPGKNLYDKSTMKSVVGYISSGSGPFTTTNPNAKSIIIPCLPNVTYTISKQAGQRFIAGYAIETVISGTTVLGSINNNFGSSITITTGANAAYLVVYFYLQGTDTISEDAMLNTLQIEKGSVATAYEPYIPYSKNPGINILSVPNGTIDTYDSGTKTYTQKVKEYTLQASDIDSLETSLSACDFVRVKKPIDYRFYSSASTENGTMILNGIADTVSVAVLNDANNIGKVSNQLSSLMTLYFVAKGTYANLAAARTALVGKKTRYQLTTPISSVLPSPTFPLEIISNVPAGTYKITMLDGIYELTLAEPLRGIGANLDRVVVDRVSKKAWVQNKCTKVIFDGSADEDWLRYAAACNASKDTYQIQLPLSALGYGTSLCSHYTNIAIIPYSFSTVNYRTDVYSDHGTNNYKYFNYLPNTTLTEWRAFLLSNPITLIYPLATPTRTMLTLTKVASSTAPELPTTSYSTAVSPDYPQFLYDAGGNIKVQNNDNSQSSTLIVPTNRGIQVASTATDYTYIDGSGNKWVADTLEYVGNGTWNKVQRIQKKVFDGTETLTTDAMLNDFLSQGYMRSIFNVGTKVVDNIGVCSHALFMMTPTYSNRFNASSVSIYLILATSIVGSTVDSTKAYLAAQNAAGTPVTVEYILTTPITTQVNLGDLKTFPWGTVLSQNGYNVASPFNLAALVMDN